MRKRERESFGGKRIKEDEEWRKEERR